MKFTKSPKSRTIFLTSLIALSCAATLAYAENDGGAVERYPGARITAAAKPSDVAAPVSTVRARTDRAARPALGYDNAPRERVRGLIASHAAANGVPFKLADAVVRIESRYNPHVSHGGALGLMQIKPQTARGVGFSGPASALYHPETNIRYGMKYLAQAYHLSGGDTCHTVMRYQSGHYATHMNGANRAYCAKARAIISRG